MKKDIYDYCDIVISGKAGKGKTNALLGAVMQEKGRVGIYCLDESAEVIKIKLGGIMYSNIKEISMLKEESSRFIIYDRVYSPNSICAYILEDKLDCLCVDHADYLTQEELLEIHKACDRNGVKLIATSQTPLRRR